MNNDQAPIDEEFDSIDDLEIKGVLLLRNSVGLEEYSESYGTIDFQVEEGTPGSICYRFEFNEEAELEFVFRNAKGSDNFLYVLEALSRGISFDDAVNKIYVSGTGKEYDIDSVLNSDNRLEKRYQEDLSKLLQQEFWK
ncbi:MAG: hypothetical protein R6V35_05620 [Candidatus Nanohaloarchaea archaeon]